MNLKRKKKMENKLDKDQKIYLIYVYEKLGRNNAKMFDFMSSHIFQDERDFSKYTQEQNHRYLLEWKRKNHIFFNEYEFGWKTINNIPTYIRYKGRLA